MASMVLPSFKSSNASRLNVEKVVNPPKNPEIIKSLIQSGKISDLIKAPKIYPIKKQPAAFTKNVAKMADKKYFFESKEIKNLKTDPAPPPINIDNKFKNIS